METKAISRLFRFFFYKKEMKCCFTIARELGKYELALLSEEIAESMWKAVEWDCDERSKAVISTLKHLTHTNGSQSARSQFCLALERPRQPK